MNTMQLKCFMAVAESLSFAAAAHQLSVTQPAVTQQIRALEDELGAKLFERTTRSVKLTPAGLTFLADARGMLTIYERSLGRFAHAEKLEFLPFSIGAQSHCELLALTEALHTLKSSVPTLLPSFQIFPFPYLADRLREGAIDAVIALRKRAAANASCALNRWAAFRSPSSQAGPTIRCPISAFPLPPVWMCSPVSACSCSTR